VVEEIHSSEDPRLSDYRRVSDPAWLREQGLFVAEGRLVVQRLLERGFCRIKSILVTPAALAALALPIDPVEVFVVPQPIVTAVTGFDFHRGCLAIAHRPAMSSIDNLASGGSLLALEGIANPDNVGGLFRVAAAFGLRGVVLDGATSDPLYRKSIRTSMGWTLALPFARDAAWPACLDGLRTAGFEIVALTPRAPAIPLAEVRLRTGRFVLMVGSEGSGLSESALGRADLQVRIPTDPAVDSLNVAVAAGIALAAIAGRER
jgi:tRNA G18 (ribose-2'-O)-methylase SpoU